MDGDDPGGTGSLGSSETSYPPGSENVEVLNGLSNNGQLINIDDIMDVVYSYKCKFCSLTACCPKEVTDHVLNVHLQHRQIMSKDEQTTSNSEVEMTLQMPSDKGQDSRFNGDEDAQASKVVMVAVQQDDIGRLDKDTVEVTQPLYVSTAQQSEQDGELVENMDSVGAQTDKCVNADRSDVDMPDESDVGDNCTKELFLCGQCSLGFNSIDECKQHMVRDHDIPLNDMTTEPPSQPAYYELPLPGPNKVSVGTQAILCKKPGRKRKQKMPDKVTQEATLAEEKITVSEEDSFESLIITEPFQSSSRRRINPPRALQKDYYLGQPKLRRRRTTKERYPITCGRPGCVAKFREEKTLQIHLTCHTDDSDTAFKCCECLKPFVQWRLLRVHLWKLHGIDMDLYACGTCDFRADTIHKMDTHEQIHSEERPYTCKVCGQSFKQHSQMCNHVTIHKRATDKKLDKWYTNKQCEICSRTFANQKCLRKHIEAVHNKMKPFVCQFCGHAASRKAMLDLHIRTHTGEKPFKCDMCDYETGDHNTLRRHRMRHTGRKPYKCQYCGYACIQAISLKTHMKNKHPGLHGIFTCSQCKYRTVNEQSLRNHIEDHKRDGGNKETTVTLDTEAEQDVAVDTDGKQLIVRDGGEQLMYTSLNMANSSSRQGPVYSGPLITVELPKHAFDACMSSKNQVMFTLESNTTGCPDNVTHLNVVIPVSDTASTVDTHCKATTFDVVSSKKLGSSDPVEMLCMAESDGTCVRTGDKSVGLVQNIIATIQNVSEMTDDMSSVGDT